MNCIKLLPPCLLAMKGCTLHLRAILKPSFLKLLSSSIFIKAKRNKKHRRHYRSKLKQMWYKFMGESWLRGRWENGTTRGYGDSNWKHPFTFFQGHYQDMTRFSCLPTTDVTSHVAPQTLRRERSAWSYWVRHLDSQTMLLNLSIVDILFNI